MIYPHKLPPFAHQREEFEAHRDDEARALWWEMGVAKTKPTIDTIAWLYLTGEITGALVLAPKGVDYNWVKDEIPAHLPDDVAAQTRVLLWESKRAGTQKYQRELTAALAHEGLLILVISYDGIMTGTPNKAYKVKNIRKAYKGCHLAKALLTSRRCMFVLDESSMIKNPSAKRTKRVLAAGHHAEYRRILDGTPVANSPFDIYPPVKFLDSTIWRTIGCGSFGAFKTRFADWISRLQNPARCEHKRFCSGCNGTDVRDHNDGQRLCYTCNYLGPPSPNDDYCDCPKYQLLTQYKNLDTLTEVVDRVGTRLLKADVLDLPPKLFEKRYFPLGPEQQKLYDTLKRDFMVLLDSGDMITAPLVITQLLRLQQVTSGYCPTDDGDTLLVPDNPRVPLLMQTLEECLPTKVIIWAKFRQDIDQIMAALAEAEIEAVRYDGKTSDADREHARHAFQKGDVPIFVGNPACAGKGLTLHAAKVVIYYNTSFKLLDRLQSEDRAHRAGMDDQPVTYIDLIAEGTYDEKIVKALRKKKDLADIIMGDRARDWI